MSKPILQTVVSVPLAELRKRPAHASELLTQALLGESLDIRARTADGKWFKVRRWDGCCGWTRSWSVAPARALSEAWHSGTASQVAARTAPVMGRPRPEAKLVCELPFGTRLPVLRDRGGWARTVLPDGRTGWVRRKFLAGIPLRPRGQGAVLSAARGFMGTPYLWGGVTPWGCDCSGLVQTVFRFCGVELARDARDQLDALRDVLLDRRAGRFRPADLLFFGTGRGAISHVAISTGGLGFIHAYGYVREGNLAEGTPDFVPDLARLFRAAARPLLGQKKG